MPTRALSSERRVSEIAQCRSVQLGVGSVLVFLNCGRTRSESTYALYAALPPGLAS